MPVKILLVAGRSLAAAACTGATPTATPHDAPGLATPTPAPTREPVAPDLDAVPPVDTTARIVGPEDVVFDTFDGDFVSLSRAEPSTIRRLRDAIRGSGDAMVTYVALAGRRELTFGAAPGSAFTDRETGSTWDLGGRATAGPLEGASLTLVPARRALWFAIARSSPGVALYEG